MRVLQIVAGLDIGGAFGGAERAGLELALALDRAQFEVQVCGFWRCDTDVEKSWQDKLERENIPVFFATPAGARRNSMDFFAGARRIIDESRKRRPDIIHAHHEGGALAALSARMRGGAVVALRTAHVPLGNEWGAGVVNALLRGIMSHAVFPIFLDAEVSISQERCDLLDRRWVARQSHRPAHLIHNAHPLAIQDVEPRRQQPPIIGCVARLSGEKGIHRLLDAMPQVLSACPDAELMLVGDGPMRAGLQLQARDLGIESRVQFLGQREDVPALLKQMSLFVLPSLYEGVSTALLEAIAAGVPVVASDVAGNQALIEDGRSGWLVPAGQPGVFADAILAALSDPAEGARRAGEAQQVLAAFSPAAATQSHAALYNRLIEQRSLTSSRLAH